METLPNEKRILLDNKEPLKEQKDSNTFLHNDAATKILQEDKNDLDSAVDFLKIFISSSKRGN